MDPGTVDRSGCPEDAELARATVPGLDEGIKMKTLEGAGAAFASAPRTRLGRALMPLVALAVLLGLMGTPAHAITGGQPDGDRHPYVALLLAPGLTFCSGALVSERTILTAGHCTDGWDSLEVEQILVSFDPQAEVDEDWLPVDASDWYTASEWLTHPDYVDAEWPFTYDYGLLYLDEPVTGIAPADLPQAGQLQPIIDSNGQVSQRFTDVGYGIQGAVVGDGPPRRAITWERKMAVQRYAPGNGSTSGLFHETWFIVNNVPSPIHGGACGGDSGSPVLWGATDTIVAVHTGGYSMGRDGVLCGRKTSLNHRIDQPIVLDWIIENTR
ncbi:trypsin-like serine protease [Ornithinimicrobium cerasi]|uniref:trypsin-like serine protease n=1 Tax=Ornithinimicrobium cerasi TaxID=2248773 RepID=UPI00137A9732|nr:trypsin-like serine protease [Ornithinimicrobium cerasi]